MATIRSTSSTLWWTWNPEEMGYEAWTQAWDELFRDDQIMAESAREIDVGETQANSVTYYESRGGDATLQVPKDIAAKRAVKQ